jgi:hypothetical protein
VEGKEMRQRRGDERILADWINGDGKGKRDETKSRRKSQKSAKRI